ncbi:hypothetical protein [Glaciecola sp. 1036]|uniref:hypothetical protein n=1 Tax=Alteromonadaceae TaxID=72275 RepID=UPI003CFEDFD5
MDSFFLHGERLVISDQGPHENNKNYQSVRKFSQSNNMSIKSTIKWIYDVSQQDKLLEKILLPKVEAVKFDSLSSLDTYFTRRNTSIYTDKAISLQELSNFLYLAYPKHNNRKESHFSHDNLSSLTGRGSSCRLIMFIQNVTSLRTGIYLYDEYDHCLYLFKKCSSRQIQQLLKANCFQDEFVSSPIMFAQLGSLVESSQHVSESVNRYIMIEDGMQIQRMYMAASTLSLACYLTGSLIKASIEKWVGIDNFNFSLSSAFVLGHYEEPEEEDQWL